MSSPIGPATAAVRRALDAIASADRPEVWISLRAPEELLAEAAALDAGPELPLRGSILAVKDNIDVAGLPTTLGLPLSRRPEPAATDAPAVARLRAAGAIVIGKTNLDQFATGLVGTRSPYGAVRNALWPSRISGGSSSGSAVAVALGMADLSLGTDTAGSGRVPAALNRIVGIKPTLGLVPVLGMRDACRPFDTITVFARDLAAGAAAAGIMAGPDPADGLSRVTPADARLAAPERPALGIPREEDLGSLDAAARESWDAAIARWGSVAELHPMDISPLLATAKLLYEGAIVAGRSAAAGEFMTDEHGLDPTVAGIVRRAAAVTGAEYVRDRAALESARAAALVALDGLAASVRLDGLVIPTAPGHPTLDDVAADPLGVNAWMGTFTNFVNLLDLAAVAVPFDDGADRGFGTTIVTRAFEDGVALDLAARFLGEEAPSGLGDDGVDLAVFGAHLRGQPLNRQLEELGARFIRTIATAESYSLFALDTVPPKPGLVHRPEGGASIAGELWRLSPGALGEFLAALPAPMTLGRVGLSDGSEVVGFGCTPAALDGARDITAHGSWPAYLASR
ncbi:allophanate hydrolase [Antiquaquibacter soli]|uniref:Allophanate hydrolase n=1 Tax=Antiquaquibacter soli TaxID=3064523 RepID=A0ABT9BQR9_9MICO|nr:allophanate hydrolase [Protaetiibacter sp. WY-16]MDO7882787.1 allophanate hydrolase [Protaetiibacter sp. WY-16]